MAVKDSSTNKIRYFLHRENGNVAIFSAFAIIPILLISFGAFDVIRMATIRSEIHGAVDAGLLSAARRDTDLPVAQVLREYMERNIDSNIVDAGEVRFTITDNSSRSGTDIRVDTEYDVETILLGWGAGRSVTVGTVSRAQQEWRNLEIALVLDVSHSMNGARIANLRTAGAEFIDQILFDSVVDLTSISIIPFGGTVNVGDDLFYAVDPSEVDSDDDGAIELGYGGFQFGGFLDHSDGHRWRGCLEMRDTDFSADDFSVRSNSVVPEFYAFGRKRPWCPGAASTALFASNDRDELQNLLRTMTLSDGTGMDIGTAIGLKALSPALRGRFSGSAAAGRPQDFHSDVQKVMVIMTDGELTSQLRPAEGCAQASMGRCRILRTPAPRARQRFEDLCDAIKDRGIVIYTIGFRVNPHRWSNSALAACPQSVAQYYHVEGLDIESAFSSIATSINGIRLTE